MNLFASISFDRRIVKKYYDGYKGKSSHHNKQSKIDKHITVTQQKVAIKGNNAIFNERDEIEARVRRYELANI